MTLVLELGSARTVWVNGPYRKTLYRRCTTMTASSDSRLIPAISTASPPL